MAYFYKPNCKCPKDAKKCTCGATWSYIADVGINPKTGRRKQKKKGGFKTKKEAEQAVARLTTDLSEGKAYVQESNIIFKDFSATWLETYRSSGKVKSSTVSVRRHGIDKLMPYLEYLKMKDITGTKYQSALNDLKVKGYETRTIESVHCAGRMIFREALKRKIVAENPTEYIVVPKPAITVQDLEQGDEIPKYLEKEELALFLRTCKEKGLPLDYEIFRLLAFSGARVGEVCALKWPDLNFTDNTLRITKTYHNDTNNTQKYELFTPKTKTSIRTIDIDPGVMEDLKRLKIRQAEFKLKHRDSYHDADFAFINMLNFYGYPLMVKIVQNRMARLLKISGLNKGLTPHSLRHTHTSLLAEAGASLEAIMQRLGHKNDDVTRNIYLHITKPVKKETSQKFSELMKGL